ncbi:MAG: hypothetical protein WCA35_31820, partial [Kovacikia sp.]
MKASSPATKPPVFAYLPRLTIYALVIITAWEARSSAQTAPPDPAQFYQTYQPVAEPAPAPNPQPPTP